MRPNSLNVICGDALGNLRELPNESVQCCVTSPPYFGLRDYGAAGQIGLEKTPEEYVAKIVEVFREVRRVLKSDGTCWVNLGDSYNGQGARSPNIQTNGDLSYRAGGRAINVSGLKEKDLVGIPWMVAFALRTDGWWLRQDIIWHKPNPMPESVTDRCTKAHEYLFLLTKCARYYYDAAAIKEAAVCGRLRGSGPMVKAGTGRNDIDSLGDYRLRESKKRGEFNGKTEAIEGRNAFRAVTDERNKRSVWTVETCAFPDAHFATYPPDLIKPCILAGSRPGDVILDPFAGSGTTGMVALELGRKALLIELNPAYVKLIEQRCDVTPGLALSV